jgi:hypothetical protein
MIIAQMGTILMVLLQVMGFLIQQTRGMLNPTTRLVDSTNNAGETPLLRAMAVGVPVVIKVCYHLPCCVLAELTSPSRCRHCSTSRVIHLFETT